MQQTIKSAFNNIVSDLVPFINNSKKDFYNMFNSFEVVPIKYRDEYLEKLDNKEFFDAMGYCLSISKGQFHKMKNENNIEEINGNYFINIKYDSELGLLLSDEESTLI